MNRWTWLLVLPWVVFVSTGIDQNGDPLVRYFPRYEDNPPLWDMQKEEADDLVEALNEAHERRTSVWSTDRNGRRCVNRERNRKCWNACTIDNCECAMISPDLFCDQD